MIHADLIRLRQARDRMDREYAEPLDVAALAGTALMSPGHFSRSFRAAFGETPYSYLMTRRIERAKALLRRGDLTVTEVLRRGGLYLTRLVQLTVHRTGRREPEFVPVPRLRPGRGDPGLPRQDPYPPGAPGGQELTSRDRGLAYPVSTMRRFSQPR